MTIETSSLMLTFFFFALVSHFIMSGIFLSKTNEFSFDKNKCFICHYINISWQKFFMAIFCYCSCIRHFFFFHPSVIAINMLWEYNMFYSFIFLKFNPWKLIFYIDLYWLQGNKKQYIQGSYISHRQIEHPTKCTTILC